jgi:hypothetical protein
MVLVKAQREWQLPGIVQVGVAGRRRERVVRIGEGNEHEEGLVLTCGVLQMLDCLLTDVTRGVHVSRNGRLVHLVPPVIPAA